MRHTRWQLLFWAAVILLIGAVIFVAGAVFGAGLAPPANACDAGSWL